MKHSTPIARGFTFVGILLVVALHGALLSAAGMAWHTARQREKERELLFVGDQFRRAIRSYALSGPGVTGQLPQSLDDLLRDPRAAGVKRHLRRIFVDPMTGAANWGLVKTPDGQRIAGVFSLSRKEPLKKANFGKEDEGFEAASRYSEWKFQYGLGKPPALPKASMGPAVVGAVRVEKRTGDAVSPYPRTRLRSSRND